MQKSDITEIFPLSFMQQTLLLHSLHEKEDQGFLQVKCRLSGNIDITVFKEAFDRTFQKHKALRTSVHWENISKPVQAVHKDIHLPWTVFNWTDKNPSEQESSLKKLLEKDRSEKLDLTRAPIARFFLIHLRHDEYYLIWTCHHILVDAWSSSVALADMLKFYEKLLNGIDIDLSTVPSYFDHLKWVKEQDVTVAKEFWQRQFKDVDLSYNVIKSSSAHSKASEYGSNHIQIDEEPSQLLRKFAKKNTVSLNTVFQGLWSVLLGSYLGTDRVMYGITANGRSGTGIMNSDEIVGMFMNVLPMCVDVNGEGTFATLITGMQGFQNESFQYDYLSLQHMLEFENTSHNLVPFDTLFIYQNIPEFKLEGGGVKITEYDSNATSNYTITFIIDPKDCIAITLKYDNELDALVADGFMNNLIKLIDLITREDRVSLPLMRDSIEFRRSSNSKRGSLETSNDLDLNASAVLVKTQTAIAEDRGDRHSLAPRNDIEYALFQLWEETLGRRPNSIRDSFFEIGGTSLMAIILFDKIEKRFNRLFSPTLLMVYPTIEQFGAAIEKNIFEETGRSVVCLKQGESGKSIFCLHSIGGQVLFYHPFVQNYTGLHSLYGIQANKQSITYLENEGIEAVANYYLQEIRRIQPKGPYAIMSYCNTNSIAMEMAQQLLDSGEKASPLIIIDAMPVGVELEKVSAWGKLLIYLNWISHGEYRFLVRGLSGKLNTVKQKTPRDQFVQQPDQLNSEKKVEEFELILDKSNADYRVKPYAGGIYYIQSNELSRQEVLKSVHKTWKKIVRGKMTTYTFKGDHINFFRKKNGEKFARLIESILNSGN